MHEIASKFLSASTQVLKIKYMLVNNIGKYIFINNKITLNI